MSETPQSPAPEPPSESSSPPPAASPGNSPLNNLTIGHVVLAAGAILLILSGPLPWQSSRYGGSASGFDLGLMGVLPFVLGIVVILVAVLQFIGQCLPKLVTVIMAIAGENAALIGLLVLLTKHSSPSVGVWFSLLGGLAVGLVFLAQLKPDKSWAAMCGKKLVP